MTNVHEHGASRRGLDLTPRTIVEATRDTFRALLGGELHTCQVGWPSDQRGWSRRSDVWIELATGARAAFELALVLPAELAARWVDRVLGGNGDSGIASASGALSEAECGVLAYLAARALRATQANYRVRDVASVREPSEPHVVWPVSFESSLGRGDVFCVMSSDCAESMPNQELTLSVFERAPSLQFTAGEVWIGERWNLSNTSAGLAGEVQLAIAGCAVRKSGLLSSGRVRTLAPSTASDELELVLARNEVRFLELARDSIAIDAARVVELRHAGTTLAHGELVSWRGAIGVRIT